MPNLRQPGLVLLIALAAGSVLAGCGGSTGKKAAATTSTTASSTTSSAASGGTSAELQTLSSEVQSAKNATFSATWTSTSSSGSTTVTLEQQPPKSVFKTSGNGGGGGGEILATGSATYYCSAQQSTSHQTCVSENGANPLAGLVGIYTGSTFLTSVQGFEAEAAAKAAGFNVSFSNATYAGLASRCVAVTANGQSYKWCVAHTGILAYAASSQSTFALTSYSSSVNSSDLSVPAGATVVTTP